jgi:hypothetical protein
VVIGQASLLLDSPRAAGGQRNDRSERQLLQILGGVIRDDHVHLARLEIDLSSPGAPFSRTAINH